MGRIKFNVHFTFIIFACILIYFGQGLLFVNYAITIILHELAHAVVAKSLGYNINNFMLMPFGISLTLSSSIMTPKDEIKVAIAGPLLNFALVIFSFAIWWIFPATFNFTYLFCYANFIEGIFNLLPAFPLDGGRVFRAIFTHIFGIKKANRACLILNILFSIMLLLLFIASIFVKVNLTCLFVLFCIIPVFNKNTGVYTFVDYSLTKKNKKILKIKNLYVSSKEKIFSVCKHIDSFSYLNLYVYNENGSLLKIIGEKEFVSLLTKYSTTSSFEEVVRKI